MYDLVVEAYDGLAFLPNFTRPGRVGAVVSLQLFCGCSSGLWNYLMSYVMTDGDSIGSLASRFGVSMDSIEAVNGILNPDNVTVGALYYIPLNSGKFVLCVKVIVHLYANACSKKYPCFNLLGF